MRYVTDVGVCKPSARITDSDVIAREDDGLAERTSIGLRSAQIEFWKGTAGARRYVRGKYRDAVRALHELHGRAPPRVHLDGVRACVAGDEVDAVYADEAELFADGAGDSARRVHERIIGGRRQNISTVPIPGSA